MGRRGRRKERDGLIEAPTPPSQAPIASRRYTPPQKKRIRFRPEWHKPLGWTIVLVGVAIAVLNDLAVFDIKVMPGAHNELYLLLAVLVAGAGTWFLGLFDRSI